MKVDNWTTKPAYEPAPPVSSNPWYKKPTRRGFIAGLFAALALPGVASAGTKIQMRGTLFRFHPQSDDDIAFQIDPVDDSETITLTPNQGSFLEDYLKGCEGSVVTITVEPEPRK